MKAKKNQRVDIDIFSIAAAIDRGEGYYRITTSKGFSELELEGQPTNIVFGDNFYNFLRIGFSYKHGVLAAYRLEGVSETCHGVYELCGTAKSEIEIYPDGRPRIGDALLLRRHVYQKDSRDEILQAYKDVQASARDNTSFATLVDRLNRRK